MADTAHTILNDFNAIAQVAARILPLVNFVPNSLGKWVSPLKAVSKHFEKQAAQIAVVSSATQAMRGRLGAVGAVMAGLNLRTAGASKAMSTLGAVGGFAASKIIGHFKGASAAARRLEQDTAQAQKQMAKLSAKHAGGSEKSFLSKHPLAVIGAVAAGAAGSFKLLESGATRLKAVFDLGDELNNAAQKTGILAGELVVLQQAAKDNGIEDITGSVNKMQGSLLDAARGAGPAATALGLINLRAQDLINQSPVDQIKAIGKAMEGIHDPGLRTNIAKGIFGKSGTDMLPLLNSASAMESAQEALGKQAQLLGNNAARFANISTILNHAGLTLRGFFVGVAADVAPMIEAAAAKLGSLDLANLGMKFGEGMKTGVEALAGAFANPSQFFETANLYLKAGMLEAGNTLIFGVKAALAIFGNEAVWDGIGRTLEGYGEILLSALLKAFNTAGSYLQATLEKAAEAVLSMLPVALGGTKGAKSRIDTLEDANRGHFVAIDKAKRGVGEHANHTPLERSDFIDARKKMIQENSAEIVRLNKPGFAGISARAAELQKESPVSNQTADALLAQGKAKLKTGLPALIDSIAPALSGLKPKDYLNARGTLAQANAAGRSIAAQGADVIASATAPGVTASPRKSPFANFGEGSMLATSSLRSGTMAGNLRSGLAGAANLGLGAALSTLLPGSGAGLLAAASPFTNLHARNMSSAFRGTPLLSAAERGIFANSYVAAGGKRMGTTEGAMHVVHSGDAARRKAFDHAQAVKDAKGLTETQAIAKHTADIYDIMYQTWSPQ